MPPPQQPGWRSIPGFVATAVVVPTFMEVLDTTIANVALRYIAGGLSAAKTDSEWVITSYLAANAIILPISGWLSAQLGRRNYFMLSIAVFTLASALCGMATSLAQIIMFRVLQGLAGGGLQPSSQGVLLDSFPPEKQGTAMTLFGIAALIGPIVGPTLGGWLVVNYDWRWIFYINVPVGLVALVAAYFLVDDPDYLKKERAELRRQPLNFDYIGLGLLVAGHVLLGSLLSKGQEWDWLGDPFWRVQTLMVLFVVGIGVLVYWEMRIANPIVNFRVLGERNLAMSCIIIFCAFAVLYAASIALPALLQSLFGYDALAAGLVLSPGGHLLDQHVGGRRLPAGPGRRCPLADRGGLGRRGGQQLLDGLHEPADQPIASGRAAHGADRRTGLDLRPDQRGRLHVHAADICAGRRWGCSPCCATRGAASARRCPKPSRNAANSSTRRASGEILDALNPYVTSFLHQAQAFFLSRPAMRPRRGRCRCKGWRTCANSRRLPGLLRRILDRGRPWHLARPPDAVDEALRRPRRENTSARSERARATSPRGLGSRGQETPKQSEADGGAEGGAGEDADFRFGEVLAVHRQRGDEEGHGEADARQAAGAGRTLPSISGGMRAMRSFTARVQNRTMPIGLPSTSPAITASRPAGRAMSARSPPRRSPARKIGMIKNATHGCNWCSSRSAGRSDRLRAACPRRRNSRRCAETAR